MVKFTVTPHDARGAKETKATAAKEKKECAAVAPFAKFDDYGHMIMSMQLVRRVQKIKEDVGTTWMLRTR